VRKEGIDEIRRIAGDYLAGAYRRGGVRALLSAWPRLLGDLAVSALAEISRTFSPLLACACVVICIDDFAFGVDLAGDAKWGFALLGITAALAFCQGTLSFRRIALFVAVDALGGACSIFITDHSLQRILRDDICWIPVAVLIVVAGSLTGGNLRRALAAFRHA
jgi:hypothetical protein